MVIASYSNNNDTLIGIVEKEVRGLFIVLIVLSLPTSSNKRRMGVQIDSFTSHRRGVKRMDFLV